MPIYNVELSWNKINMINRLIMALFYQMTTYDKKSQLINCVVLSSNNLNMIKTPFYCIASSSNELHMIKTPFYSVILSSNEL